MRCCARQSGRRQLRSAARYADSRCSERVAGRLRRSLRLFQKRPAKRDKAGGDSLEARRGTREDVTPKRDGVCLKRGGVVPKRGIVVPKREGVALKREGVVPKRGVVCGLNSGESLCGKLLCHPPPAGCCTTLRQQAAMLKPSETAGGWLW
jgi:hypothetical protein